MTMDAKTYHEILEFIAALYADLQTALYGDGRRGIIPPEAVESTISKIDHTAFILVNRIRDELADLDFVQLDNVEPCHCCGSTFDHTDTCDVEDVADWPEDDSYRVPDSVVRSYYDDDDELQVRWYNPETKEWQDERPAGLDKIEASWNDEDLPF